MASILYLSVDEKHLSLPMLKTYYSINQYIHLLFDKVIVKLWMLVIGILMVITIDTSAQNYRTKHYTVEDGLPTDYVYGVIEDNDGYIWAYTEAGIAKFNGYEWMPQTDPRIEGADVVMLQKNRDDNYIYGLNFNHGVFVLEKDSCIANFENHHLLLNGRSNVIISGTAWNYFDEITKKLEVKYDFENDNYLPIGTRFSINTSKDIVYNIISPNEIELHQKNKTNTKITIAELSKMPYCLAFYTIEIGGQEFLIFQYSDSVYAYNTETDEGKFILRTNKNDNSFISLDIANNLLYVQSSNGYSAFDYKLNLVDKYNVGALGQEHDINRSIKDSKGNIWIASRSSGIFFIAKEWQNSTIENINNEVFEGLVKAWNDRLFAASDKGALYEIRDQNFIPVHSSKTEIRFKRLFYDKKLDLLCFDKNSEISYYDKNLKHDFASDLNEGKKYISNLSSHLSNSRGKDAIDQGNNAIKSTDDEDFLYIYNASAFYVPYENPYFKKRQHFYSRYVKNVTGSNNSMIIPQKDHIYRIHGNEGVDSLAIDSNYAISYITEFDDQSYLIGTTKSGVLRLNYSERKWEKNLDCKYVKAIIQHQGEYLIASHSGIYRLNAEFEVLRHYTMNDGLPSNEVYDVEVKSEYIIAATSKGVAYIDLNYNRIPEADSTNIILKALLVNGKAISNKSLRSISYKDNNISITSELVHYASAGDITYEYRLLPDHEEWTQTSSRTVDFYNLEPQKYTYDIRAIDAFGNVHLLENEIQFNISSPVWRKPWFLFLLFGCSLAFLYYWMRKKEVKRATQSQKEIRLKKRMAELELNAIRSQMNPHFIYNALGAIQYYIQTHKVDEADNYLTDFALLMRKFLDSSRDQSITIREEIELLTLYTNLEKMRFENKFDVEITTNTEAEDNLDHKLPSMILQPYVENAILHGLSTRKSDGKLSIDFKFIDDYSYSITIIDNGVGIENSKNANKNSIHKSRALSIIEEKVKTLKTLGTVEVNIKTEIPFSNLEFPGTKVVITINNIDQ